MHCAQQRYSVTLKPRHTSVLPILTDVFKWKDFSSQNPTNKCMKRKTIDAEDVL